eukprot:jgi/Botrbrau1/891/Bobra.0167s0014.1
MGRSLVVSILLLCLLAFQSGTSAFSSGESRKLLQAAPASPCGKNDVLPVSAGQSCDSIAEAISMSVDDIVALNPEKCDNLKAGDILCIPAGKTLTEDPPSADNKEGL